MAVTNNKFVHYKIFKEKDLENLINFLLNVEKDITKDKEYNRLSFKIYFEDNTSIEDESKDPNILTDTKLIDSVKFSFVNHLQNIMIEINLRKNGGYFSVKGENHDWVDAKFIQLDKIFNNAPNQKKKLASTNSQIVISNLTASPLVLLLVYFITKVVPEDFLVHIFFAITFQAFFASIIHVWLKGLHTNIEFDTSLDHLNKNKLKKNSIKYMWATFLFPFVLATFFYALTL